MGVETVYRSPAPMWSEKAQSGYRGNTPRKKGKDNYDLNYFLL